MGYSERKKSLGSGMTGGRGVLPIWIDFMKTFLKDKEKENFEKAPKMPEDIRELHLQRQREMAEERESFMAARGARGDERLLPALNIEPKLEQITLPPAAGEGLTATNPPPADDTPKKPEAVAPREDDPPPPAPPARPREREPEQPKKKGKKGSDEP
jgi:penicillin-binding protein 1A